jgi:hypothetical protein
MSERDEYGLCKHGAPYWCPECEIEQLQAKIKRLESRGITDLQYENQRLLHCINTAILMLIERKCAVDVVAYLREEVEQ